MKRLLLIEPDKILSEVYSDYFTGQGYKVIAANSAQSAIEVTDKNLPDIIVLELQLPGHSGVEFLYELRSYSDFKDVPVIINSLLPQSDLKKYSQSWRQLNVLAVVCKTETTLAKLGQLVAAAEATK